MLPLRRQRKLTDSCRVWLTKLSSKNVFLEMKVILCSGREDLALRANFCFILCSFRQGRLALLLILFYPLFFQAGKVALRANFWFYPLFFQAGKVALRANFWFILCSRQED